MDQAIPEADALAALDASDLWAELGKAVRAQDLGMLPEEEEGSPSDAQAGYWYFKRQLANIRKIYCTEAVTALVTEEKKRDVTSFVASLIDLFAAYFGVLVGTLILVQIYKIGVDRFCKEDVLPPSSEPADAAEPSS